MCVCMYVQTSKERVEVRLEETQIKSKWTPVLPNNNTRKRNDRVTSVDIVLYVCIGRTDKNNPGAKKKRKASQTAASVKRNT